MVSRAGAAGTIEHTVSAAPQQREQRISLHKGSLSPWSAGEQDASRRLQLQLAGLDCSQVCPEEEGWSTVRTIIMLFISYAPPSKRSLVKQ